MNKKDFSKPFFMSGQANSNWGDGWGPFKQQDNWNRYNEAYGNYQGGYGPGRGFGPGGPRGMGGPGPLMMGGPGPMGGPPMCGPGPMGPPGRGPRFGMWPRGGPPGFGGGPMPPHNPVKFLQKCGVPFETIKNLPRPLLRNFLPNHCGICKMDFDTFAFARMHYCSKNHTKNQRKWLLETPQGSSKEQPLKSRDLYCELCDVQITSKVHADSHYAGKPHRAVVEGRKKPKNADLLKPGAHARVEQLLKREKRFIKTEAAAAKAAEAAAGGEQAKPPAKPLSSEFYCDICKSAMSCSEQMTAHLNGKRHLSKEKQHILKMMKNPNGATEEAAGDAVGDNDEGEGENGDKNGEEEGEGNGNGNGDAEDSGDDVEEVIPVEDDDAVVVVPTEDDSWVHGTGDGWDQPQKQDV